MSFLLVLLCCAGTLVASWPQPSKVYYDIADAERHFSEFINTFEKQYSHDEEKDSRFQIFKKNLEMINHKNQEDDLAVFGINRFSDLTTEEFLRRYTGYNHTGNSNCQIMPISEELRSVEAPEELDWRQQGIVTEVKDQSQCESCWAFSTTGNVEGQYAIKHKQLVEFSEQQLLDCIKKTCHGGYYMSSAIETLRQNNGGLMLESAYPYTGMAGTCNYNPSAVVVQITGCQTYALQSEEELKQLVASVGPLAIAVASRDFHQYHGGILNNCGGNIDHGVLLVGYGTESGVPYWLIKNSWGPGWGEQGYVKVPRGMNACNIMNGEHVTAEVA